MSCTNCNNNSDKPNGCKSNGHCTSGCSGQMSAYNWLSNIENTSHNNKDIVEVSFKNGRKKFCYNDKKIPIYTGDVIVVQASPGTDVGVVSLTGQLVQHQRLRKKDKSNVLELKKVIRKVNDLDLKNWKNARSKENETMHESREMAIKLGLDMKLSDVEYQGDGSKAIFYYTAEKRVDFRELIKVMADKFNLRIEMKQIGARQESARLGGIASCGRELCCSTWMSDFRSVTTSAARYQQLALNPQKLAGQCGKLKCCLNYELDQYMEQIKKFPSTKIMLESKNGKASHLKTDVFKNKMWYLVQKKEGITSILEFTVNKVMEIIKMNKEGKKPDDFTIHVTSKDVEKGPDYKNVVGQDELTRFDNVFKKIGRASCRERV